MSKAAGGSFSLSFPYLGAPLLGGPQLDPNFRAASRSRYKRSAQLLDDSLADDELGRFAETLRSHRWHIGCISRDDEAMRFDSIRSLDRNQHLRVRRFAA